MGLLHNLLVSLILALDPMLDQLRPPSDNLYKFIAVSGVLLVLASIYLAFTWFRDYESTILTAMSAQDALALRLDRFERQVEEMGRKQAIDRDFFDCLEASGSSPNNEKAIIQCALKFEKTLDGVLQRYEEINDALQKVYNDTPDLEEKVVLMKAKTREASAKGDALVWGRISLAVIFCFGVCLAWIGFRRWYYLQRDQDALLRLELNHKASAAAANKVTNDTET